MLYNATFIGRIGTDAETVTTGATPFINCRIAIDDSNGKEKSTRWVSLNLNAERFKNIAQYLTKGRLVFVSGSERVRAYLNKNGEPGVDTNVWVDKIEFVPTGQKQEGSSDTTTSTPKADNKEDRNKEMTVSTRKSSPKADTSGAPEPLPDDDLPF